MELIEIYLFILVVVILMLPFLKVNAKGIITLVAVMLSAGVSGFMAVQALSGNAIEITLAGTLVTGAIPLRIDALSAWFILLINFTIITGGLYGLQYMRAYREQSANLTFHCIAYLLIQASLTTICVVQHAIIFLFAWEVMALASFTLIIFEHRKQAAIKAGINYLVQSHICIMFLTVGFIWVASRMNSYDFIAIRKFSESFSLLSSLVLFFCFFVGFAIKAGFVPFHTWLPYAHPAAPSHISGIMSGVIIKIGIYGILRMILLIKTDYVTLGYIILIISVISGVYGVMLAILQHNLKKLLAYHSIENIGIIGIGIGLGTIGIGMNNVFLTTIGFAGAMLHVLNHSLFKSLLFYGAGNVYQATHTLNIEHLGGLIKKMPHTAVLFLVAALAICGLPPFNGFISEFLIYSGLYSGLNQTSVSSIIIILSAIFGLVLIGGLALLCFTKAFGAVFLGNQRKTNLYESTKNESQEIGTDQSPITNHQSPTEANTGKLIPMYIITALIVAIGIFPSFFLQLLSEPVKLFSAQIAVPWTLSGAEVSHNSNLIPPPIEYIGYFSAVFMLLAGLVFFIRQKITAQRPVVMAETWGCGYVGDTSKMQYTASSFIRTYRKLAEPLLFIQKKKIEIKDVFPLRGKQETQPYDKIEAWLIDTPLKQIKYFLDKFRFLQNGNVQFYALYGVVFILLVIGLPFVYDAIKSFIGFLNHL